MRGYARYALPQMRIYLCRHPALLPPLRTFERDTHFAHPAFALLHMHPDDRRRAAFSVRRTFCALLDMLFRRRMDLLEWQNIAETAKIRAPALLRRTESPANLPVDSGCAGRTAGSAHLCRRMLHRRHVAGISGGRCHGIRRKNASRCCAGTFSGHRRLLRRNGGRRICCHRTGGCLCCGFSHGTSFDSHTPLRISPSILCKCRKSCAPSHLSCRRKSYDLWCNLRALRNSLSKPG